MLLRKIISDYTLWVIIPSGLLYPLGYFRCQFAMLLSQRVAIQQVTEILTNFVAPCCAGATLVLAMPGEPRKDKDISKKKVIVIIYPSGNY